MPVELHILHEVVEGSLIFRGHAIVELNYQWAVPVVSVSRTLGSQECRRHPALGDGRHAQPAPKQRQEQHQSGRDEQRDVESDGIGEAPSAQTANCEAPRERNLPSRNGLARNPARGVELHANVE
ncbi:MULTISPECIES: hypothetical protein [unclassified Bradyrhizobium]|uniref:hypothetical protein n=1 Tax=unclassified Bradyrhizobium TaxID=2631580 RepID=UPI001FFC1F02